MTKKEAEVRARAQKLAEGLPLEFHDEDMDGPDWDQKGYFEGSNGKSVYFNAGCFGSPSNDDSVCKLGGPEVLQAGIDGISNLEQCREQKRLYPRCLKKAKADPQNKDLCDADIESIASDEAFELAIPVRDLASVVAASTLLERVREAYEASLNPGPVEKSRSRATLSHSRKKVL